MSPCTSRRSSRGTKRFKPLAAPLRWDKTFFFRCWERCVFETTWHWIVNFNPQASSDGTTHSVRNEEEIAFSAWINSNLASDPDLKHILPIKVDDGSLYLKVQDGTLLWWDTSSWLSTISFRDDLAIFLELNENYLTLCRRLFTVK